MRRNECVDVHCRSLDATLPYAAEVDDQHRAAAGTVSEIVSGEGVSLDLERAGVGSRTVAAVLDVLVQLGAFIAAGVIDTRLAAGDDAMVQALFIIEFVLILAGYPILFEWLTRGRTLGKMALGLRVVRDDGGPIGFRQALVRGLSGFLLEKPGLLPPLGTAVGLGLIAFSASGKRVGDFMAGTFVISERSGSRIALSSGQYTVPYELQPWAMALDLTRLDDQLAFGLRQFVLRAEGMTPQAAEALGTDFRAKVMAVISPQAPYPIATPVFLMTVLAERRRRADIAAMQAGSRHSRQMGTVIASRSAGQRYPDDPQDWRGQQYPQPLAPPRPAGGVSDNSAGGVSDNSGSNRSDNPFAPPN
jgi:uncharacterized RDD family membrane protein YckC